MARRSTTSSNGTTVISTRSIRCSSVPPRCGSRARGAARRITPVARTPTCCARRSSRAETRALRHPLLTQGAILMHRALLSVAAPAALGALALLAACARPQPAAPGVQWAVIVLYNQPKDTAAFEKYYAEKHIPLFAAHAKEIGVARAELVKFAVTIDGQAPALYREGDLRFESREALEKGIATPGFKMVAGDLANFATGGVTVLIGAKTN